MLQAPGGPLGWYAVRGNLLPVLAGNLVGGAMLVGLVYRFIYRASAGAGAQPVKNVNP